MADEDLHSGAEVHATTVSSRARRRGGDQVNRWQEGLDGGLGNGRRNSDVEDDGHRFWFPSITGWYEELDKVKAVTVMILFFCNLINYMDRSTVAGMIEYIKNDPWFHVKSDKDLGLLQTGFVVFYMLTAPVFGYLGDRFNRRIILMIGLGVWSLSSLAGSFCKDFWLFMFFRAMVGVGEASYTTIAPALISDLYVSGTRSTVLAVFYFAIPVGTGFGYIVGSEVAQAASDWRWGLRVTPILGMVAVAFILVFLVDPPRGESEHHHPRVRTPFQDVLALVRNKSFVLSSFAFSCVAFSVGALMWWGPEFAYYGARAACGNKADCSKITQAGISYKFGLVMTVAGIFGVPLGSAAAQALRREVPEADPLVCGGSLLLSVPVMFFGFIAARYSLFWCYLLTFLAGLLLNSNWAIVSDITMYIVIPTRRSFASAAQILLSHCLGDAISPYLIGAVADAVRNQIVQTSPKLDFVEQQDAPATFEAEFRSLQYAFFICCFAQALGGFFFLVMSWYVIGDKDKALEDTIADERSLIVPDGVGEERLDTAEPVRNTFADEF